MSGWKYIRECRAVYDDMNFIVADFDQSGLTDDQMAKLGQWLAETGPSAINNTSSAGAA